MYRADSKSADKLKITPLGVADADRLAVFSRQAFAAAFEPYYAPEDLAAYLGKDHTPAYYRERLQDLRFHCAMLTKGDAMIGYVLCGPVILPVENSSGHAVELHRIYLATGCSGMGLGQRLLDYVLDWAVGEGAGTLYLGVFSENTGAIRFYERAGFERVGEYVFMVGQQADREFIYRRRLSAD